ncbi:hypothetical protein UFOVP775_34 [uncultured Caudovirales phage]|uniref:Uncharacterized protein n=1 Tax=uncultured Caudovirales phage TaxID=2100421 RepID=A0A6J5NZ73_9CAUD|nr:hypothetical protein UFOVP775_34 [uncultured Caudovirales phage]
MAGELFINGRLVDISQDAPFPLTFNISDIKDLNARKGNKSKTITLPGTKNNTALMLSVFTLSATEKISVTNSDFIDFDPSVKAECQYYQNGLLEFNGVAQLMSCKHIDGIWSFEVTLVSDTIDYISRLAKIKINELGYSEYNHALTYANQQDTWNGTIQFNGNPVSNQDSQGWKGKGYYYGLIDYGFTRATPSTFAVAQIPPQVFCYDILTRAFAYCGISWNSRFLESQRFKRMLMAYPGGDLPTIDSTQANTASVFTTEQNNSGGFVINSTSTVLNFFLNGGFPPPPNFITFPSDVFYDLYDCTVTQDDLSQAQTNSPLLFVSSNNGLFTVQYQGQHDITWTTAAGAFIFGNYKLRLIIYRNNFEISDDEVYEGYVQGQATGYSLSVNFDYSRQIDLSINDTLSFKLKFTSQYEVADLPTVFDGVTTQIVSSGVDLDILFNEQSLTPSGPVFLDSFLPDMTCDVFFKGLVTAFNLYVKPSVADPTILEIEPLSDFYRSSGDAIDWTYKLDRSKEIQIEPTINFSAKNYKFNFETDDDYWNGRYFDDVQKQYGSFIVESQSQFATNETNFKLPFSQKLLSTIPDTSPGTFTDLTVPRVFQIKFNEDGTSLVERKKGKPFLVQLGGLRTGDWIHVDENGTPYNETSYPYVGHLDNLDSPSFDFNFGVPDYVFWSTPTYPTNNLYLYHEKFIKELISRYGKKVTCSVMLRASDINSLDFRNLIQIDGVVYRLLKVSDYQSGKNTSTVVELIRIIEGEGIQTTIVTPP